MLCKFGLESELEPACKDIILHVARKTFELCMLVFDIIVPEYKFQMRIKVPQKSKAERVVSDIALMKSIWCWPDLISANVGIRVIEIVFEKRLGFVV